MEKYHLKIFKNFSNFFAKIWAKIEKYSLVWGSGAEPAKANEFI